MRRLPPFASVALLGALIAGCADQPTPTEIEPSPDRPPISSIRIRGGGFDNAGDAGLLAGTRWPPFPWRLPADIGQGPDFEQQCLVQGHCGVGHAGFRSFAGLGVPSNPDPNPGPRAFAVLSTTNFFMDIDFDQEDELIRTTESAIARTFTLPAGGWQLQVDLALLTGETGAGAQNDFASITIKSLTSGGTPVEVLRFEADDPLAWKPGGCDAVTFRGSGVKSAYPRCTDWTPYAVDVSRFGGERIKVMVRVGEGGPDNDVATSLAVDNLKFLQVPAVGRISFSPSPARAGRSVQARAGFFHGDATAMHRARWNWGDGTSTNPGTLTQGPRFGLVSNSHTYSRSGTYTITVTVIDNDGDRGTRQRQITVLAAVLTAQIDIRPHSNQNTVRLGSQELIPVALLGSGRLKVADVAVASLRFGPAHARPVSAGRIQDVNGDSFADLVTHYRTQETGIQLGNDRACLAGTKRGTRFRGCDVVTVVN